MIMLEKAKKPLDLETEFGGLEEFAQHRQERTAREHLEQLARKEKAEAVARFEAHKHKHRVQKMLSRALGWAICSSAVVVLGSIGLINGLLAVTAVLMSLCIGSFFFGQYWRMRHED